MVEEEEEEEDEGGGGGPNFVSVDEGERAR